MTLSIGFLVLKVDKRLPSGYASLVWGGGNIPRHQMGIQTSAGGALADVLIMLMVVL
jgi:hypothetical protein